MINILSEIREHIIYTQNKIRILFKRKQKEKKKDIGESKHQKVANKVEEMSQKQEQGGK